MSRWRNDPDAAAARLLAGSLARIDVGGRVLLANPPAADDLLARLAERGSRCDVWVRRLDDGGGIEPRPWPLTASVSTSPQRRASMPTLERMPSSLPP